MFDISFAELLMIAIVGLLVIGPERLPKVARTLGAYTGRLQRYVAEVKEEVNREVRFEELQALQQEIKEGVTQAESNVKASLMSGERDIDQALYELGEEVDAKKAPVKTTKAKPVAKKPAPKKVPAKKTATRKPAAKKTAAKNPAVKKQAARKSPARKSSVKPADKKVD